jgi:hypothetical protein
MLPIVFKKKKIEYVIAINGQTFHFDVSLICGKYLQFINNLFANK